MAIIGGLFLLAGFIIALVYGIMILIKAFQASILWGLGSIFIPFVSLIFVIMHWEETKGPFLKGLLCIPCYIIGFVLMPAEVSEVFYPALLAG